jgi:hypothetical protein
MKLNWGFRIIPLLYQFNSNKINSLQIYGIARNYRNLHEVLQRLKFRVFWDVAPCGQIYVDSTVALGRRGGIYSSYSFTTSALDGG